MNSSRITPMQMNGNNTSKDSDSTYYLGNGNSNPHKGKFYAEDRNLDTKTGAIRMELTFPNPGNRLRPGQFGKVRAVIKVEKDALVIPQEAVTELQGTQMVGVVDGNSKVNMRPVKMGNAPAPCGRYSKA